MSKMFCINDDYESVSTVRKQEDDGGGGDMSLPLNDHLKDTNVPLNDDFSGIKINIFLEDTLKT